MYKEMKNETDISKKILLIKKIAAFRNMKHSFKLGALGRGINIYIHPASSPPMPYHFITWIPKL
jgi:hypothetical protein